MPITSVEKSKYVSQQQDFLWNLRVGQYAKFLDKNPIFVTYYPISHAQSRVDAGSGSAYEYIGPHSPIRYNRVKEVPIFNFPDTIRPEVERDEGGYNISSELSDITFIPGTVRPREGDCMLVKISGALPLLYQCTEFRHNSIQSNDYYFGDFTLVDVDQEYVAYIDKQVVDKYVCHFENIGTNQKILISEEEDKAGGDLDDLIAKLKDFYKDAFYNEEVDGFVLYDGNRWGTQWYYDIFLTRFINESQIYEDDSSDYTLILPYLELEPLDFSARYKRMVWFAVLNRTVDYFNQYNYFVPDWIHSRTSPLTLHSIPAIGPMVHIADKHLNPAEPVPDEVIKKLPYVPALHCGFDGVEVSLQEYFSYALSISLKENRSHDDLNDVEKIIFDYIQRGPKFVEYDRQTLINRFLNVDLFTYMHMPIIIYILKQVRDGMHAVDE